MQERKLVNSNLAIQDNMFSTVKKSCNESSNLETGGTSKSKLNGLVKASNSGSRTDISLNESNNNNSSLVSNDYGVSDESD